MIKLYYTFYTPDAPEGRSAAPLSAKEHRLGRSLLIRALTDQGMTGIDEKWLEENLVIGPYEKPELPAGSGLHFNISHCDGLVACALSDSPIGVDAETLDHHTEAAIFRRVLAEPEKAWVRQAFAPPLSGDRREVLTGQRLEAFIRIWTLKESRVKECGMGLSMPLTAFEFETTDIKRAMDGDVHGVYTIQSSEKELYFRQVKLPGDWIISICSPLDEDPVIIP